MSTPKDNDFAERRKTAIEARKALLEKFKAKPDENDPAVQAKIAERKAIAEAREARAEQKRIEAAEKAEQERLRQEQLEQDRLAEEARKKAEADAHITRLLADEAERKAARDARYAARKQRKK
ncbi:hypothetical protein ASG43_02520 [Aureimonas sp. Leaf454]|uniref:DUF6481 family protein n=1 Tax=Aureimonas sp. Leaf454 TaxID=1736381 RepID=UPI0006FE423E|nr:DUF6481 family protein [Aureimonas sp. Leaf454]KQT54488.1 hypothetical protein ASG43_02520 [Aureimonas sp. Leaf454]